MLSVMTFHWTVRSPVTVSFPDTVSPANVGLLVVVSHPLKFTALAVAAVPEIFIPHVPEAHTPVLVA